MYNNMEKRSLLSNDSQDSGEGEIYELYGTLESPPPRSAEAPRDHVLIRLSRLLFIVSCLTFGVYYVVSRAPFGRINVPSSFHYLISPVYSDDNIDVELSAVDDGQKKKVPLEAHIMSKCPDARDCLQQLIVPTMEQVHDNVDFRLSFIAR